MLCKGLSSCPIRISNSRILFQEAKNVDEAFITIARAALQQEADTELSITFVSEIFIASEVSNLILLLNF